MSSGSVPCPLSPHPCHLCVATQVGTAQHTLLALVSTVSVHISVAVPGRRTGHNPSPVICTGRSWQTAPEPLSCHRITAGVWAQGQGQHPSPVPCPLPPDPKSQAGMEGRAVPERQESPKVGSASTGCCVQRHPHTAGFPRGPASATASPHTAFVSGNAISQSLGKDPELCWRRRCAALQTTQTWSSSRSQDPLTSPPAWASRPER